MTVKYIDPESFYIKIQIDFATAYGVNVAILTGKLYRLERELTGKTDDEGLKWIRLSNPEWQAELPFFSEATIKRTISDAEALTILLSRTFAGRCKWYRLNPAFVSGQFDTIGGNVSGQNDTIGGNVSGQNDTIEARYQVNLTQSSGQFDTLPRILSYSPINPKNNNGTAIFQKLLELFQYQTSEAVYHKVFQPLEFVGIEGETLTVTGPALALEVFKGRWLKRVQQTATRFGISQIIIAQGVQS
jgi:hypothetical protein